jgi:hypothetical protein
MLFVISRADAGGRVGFLPRDHARQKDVKPQGDASSLSNHLLRGLSPLLRNDPPSKRADFEPRRADMRRLDDCFLSSTKSPTASAPTAQISQPSRNSRGSQGPAGKFCLEPSLWASLKPRRARRRHWQDGYIDVLAIIAGRGSFGAMQQHYTPILQQRPRLLHSRE